MRLERLVAAPVRLPLLIVVGIVCQVLISCGIPPKKRGGIEPYPGWYMASQAQGRPNVERPPVKHVSHPALRPPLPVLKVALPKVPDADYIGEDELCMECHENHTKAFLDKNVHRNFSCEDCHGPASEHIASRGQEEGKILNVRRLQPFQRAEVCLRCHEKEVTPTHVQVWRTSVHAHKGVSCSNCHRVHHELPPGTPAIAPGSDTASARQVPLAQRSPARDLDAAVRRARAAKVDPAIRRAQTDELPQPKRQLPSLRKTSHDLDAGKPATCYRCHQGSHRLTELVGPHKTAPAGQLICTMCHDAQGTLTPENGREVCLKCHSSNQVSPWHDSTHAQAGLFCTDCHNPHPAITKEQYENLKRGLTAGLPRPMYVSETQSCLRCHDEMKSIVEIASPHQVGGGRSGLQCTTCHDPHGKVREETRQTLCLNCHTRTLETSWLSSTHNLQGIKCTDCHNPHPSSRVERNVDIRHTNIRRPERRPMSVNDPDTCYKCHPQMVAMTQLPSHHPIFEGKMNCSSCHDPHGQALRLLKEPQVNLVCYPCHMEYQGPFVYEHPPVTQDCTICHNPHGTVANNLLKQPVTFLCLRCHSGHRTGPTSPNHSTTLGDIGTSQTLQKAFFTDCTQCHSQVHGSNVPSPHNNHVFAR